MLLQGKLKSNEAENKENIEVAKKRWNSAELIDVVPLNHKINGAESEENELNLYENISQKPLRSSTVTPSSFSESSFDEARSSKSHEMLTERGSTKKRVNIRTELDLCNEKVWKIRILDQLSTFKSSKNFKQTVSRIFISLWAALSCNCQTYFSLFN